MTLDNEFSDHHIHKPFGGNRRVGVVLNLSQRDQEFIPTQTGHRVLFPPPCLKTFCDFLQEEVADRVPQRVVDGLEAVEIQKQKR
jgi:hypothetical protein